MKYLIQEVEGCSICKDYLPLGPNPIIRATTKSRILIIGQAPGIRVHNSGIPWNDPSGERLRNWLKVSSETFYDPENFAIIPMGFCYPGKGKSGDLPPRKECAPQWHERLLEAMPEIKLTLLIGLYAQKYYLKSTAGKNLTETVRQFENYLPDIIPLPHPSPRNIRWFKQNPWFEADLLPVLKIKIQEALR